jgi:hypothetical protein
VGLDERESECEIGWYTDDESEGGTTGMKGLSRAKRVTRLTSRKHQVKKIHSKKLHPVKIHSKRV